MPHRALLALMFLALAGLLSPASGAIGAAQSACLECDAVVTRVLKLLPRKPASLIVLDAPSQPPALQTRIESSEGFVVPGGTTVYLKKQGSTFQHALQGAGIWDYALAIIVWHEMALVDGADECQAQRKEEELWNQFIVQRRVDSSRGLNYLRRLRQRRCTN